MKLSEAIAAMEAGKKVRYTTWDVGEFIQLDESLSIVDEDGSYHDINFDAASNDEAHWELYDPEIRLNFLWAWTEMNNGTLVRRRSWPQERLDAVKTGGYSVPFLTIKDINAGDWERWPVEISNEIK